MPRSTSTDISDKSRSKKRKHNQRQRSPSSDSSSSSSASSRSERSTSNHPKTGALDKSNSSKKKRKTSNSNSKRKLSTSSSSASSYKASKRKKEKKKKHKKVKKNKKKEKNAKTKRTKEVVSGESTSLAKAAFFAEQSSTVSRTSVGTAAISASLDQPVGPSPRVMKPMTKEEWEKQQSIMRHVFDEESGRMRLIKGDGEVIEEIVSKERQKDINKMATQGDGKFFASKMGLL